MFKWYLGCAMASPLEPRYLNRISVWWMRTRGLDQVLSSDGSVGLLIPGQRVLSRLALAFSPVDRAQDDEASLAHEGVEFELCGPNLQPSDYATPVTDISRLDNVACSVCTGDLVDFWDEASSLNVCGHLFHHNCLDELVNDVQPWSNKCPVCRRGICPPRARRALIPTVPDEERELDGEDEDQESEDGGWEDGNTETETEGEERSMSF